MSVYPTGAWLVLLGALAVAVELGFSVCSFCTVAHPARPRLIAAQEEIRSMFFMICKTKDDQFDVAVGRSVHLQAVY